MYSSALSQKKINSKTKPLGALGVLEKIALQICDIQQTSSPSLQKPTILVFAADHGLSLNGLSAYPQEVTYQMVLNFLQGGAAINVFCNQNKIDLKIIDAGVNYSFQPSTSLINAKVGMGTKNCLFEPAMNIIELEKCLDLGAQHVKEISENGSNIVGFGEMGIGNTSSAALIMSQICGLPIKDCVGAGTGLDEDGINKKIYILNKIKERYSPKGISEILCSFGGFEIVQMCGAMLEAYRQNMVILVDGFIATAAFLAAHQYQKDILKNAIFCHLSEESGHLSMLDYLGVEPILDLNLRLGEGTGCAVAYPIIKSAVCFLNEMASFDDAGVTNI